MPTGQESGLDPITAAAVGQLLGGLGGEMFGDNGEAARRRAMEILSRVNEQTGEVAPDMRNNQAQAVEYLRQAYANGGMDPQSRAALEQAQASTAARERMSRGAITQGAQTRGVGGSGVEIAAQLANQQGAANGNRMAGTQAAGDARQRAIQSLLGSSQIAGQVRGQDSALAQFNASQRLRKAGMMADQYSSDAATKNDRFDFGQLGGFAGTALAGLYSSKKPEEER